MSSKRIEAMVAAARSAGTYVLGAKNSTIANTKSSTTDFVTVADIKSQDILRHELAKAFADQVILSEEDSEADRQPMYQADFTGFVLDPIDGTYNFKRGMQESAISVGYIEHGQAVAGVVYDAYKNEMFTAEQGAGAFLNGQPIKVSQQAGLDGASVATSNGYDYAAAKRNLARQIAIYDASGVMPWTSCPGSAVLALVWVACGRIDGLHHTGFKPWDNAAALLICREAGASVTSLTGGEVRFTDAKLLVATPQISDELIKIFSSLPTELLD